MRLRPQKGIGWRSCHNETGHWMRIHHVSPCFTMFHPLSFARSHLTFSNFFVPCESMQIPNIIIGSELVFRCEPHETHTERVDSSLPNHPRCQDVGGNNGNTTENVQHHMCFVKLKIQENIYHTIPRYKPTNTYTIHSYMCIHNMLYLCMNI